MLSTSLKGVIAQTLCRKRKGDGRVAAMEILVVNSAVSNIIREGKTHQIPSTMQTGAREGMRLLNDSLIHLVMNREIEPEEAFTRSNDRRDMLEKLQVAGADVSGILSEL